MTQKENQLLLKDLCARLPYGLKVKCEKYSFPVTVLYAGNINEVKFVETGGIEHICLIKPYLRPMSSMTDEERMFFHQNSATLPVLVDTYRVIYKRFYAYRASLIDWLLRNHFDWRGLIEQGLALEAPEGMYAQVT